MTDPATAAPARDAVAATLHDLGVDVVFSLLGSSNFQLVQRLVDRHGVRHYWARHEAAVVSMADGWARASGRVGVCTVHQGPGLSNAVTALVEAGKARTPMVVVAGEVSTTDLGSNQQIDQETLARAAGAGVERVLRARTAVAQVRRAWNRAIAERRPIVLCLPMDVQAEPCCPDPVPGLTVPQRAVPTPAALESAVALIAQARRPVILAGRGAVLSGAEESLRRLGERAGALLATTAPAKGMFEADPWSVGISGGFASPVAQRLLPQADLVVAFGAGLNSWTTRHDELITRTVRLVAVNTDPADLLRHRPADVALVGDARETADALVNLLEERAPTGRGFRELVSPETLAQPGWDICDESTADRVDPRVLLTALDERLPPRRTLVTDSGRYIGWVPMHMSVAEPGAFVFSQAFMSLGLGLATGLGAAAARPDALAVVVIGDGGLLMSLGELDSIRSQGLPVLVVVMDDGAYGAEVHHFRPMGEPTDLVTFGTRDFAGVARSLGARATVVTSLADLDGPLTEWAAAPDGLFLLDCKINGDVVAHWAEEAFRSH